MNLVSHYRGLCVKVAMALHTGGYTPTRHSQPPLATALLLPGPPGTQSSRCIAANANVESPLAGEPGMKRQIVMIVS